MLVAYVVDELLLLLGIQDVVELHELINKLNSRIALIGKPLFQLG